MSVSAAQEWVQDLVAVTALPPLSSGLSLPSLLP